MKIGSRHSSYQNLLLSCIKVIISNYGGKGPWTYYNIIWLLEEAQKIDSALDINEEKVVKKHRSSSNLAEKSN